MPKFEDDHSDGNESAHSLDSEYGGMEVPIMRTPGAKKVLTTTSEKLYRCTREKYVVNRFGYNVYLAYHYAFMMKMAIVRESESFSEVAKDPRWVEAMNKETQTLSNNETWDLIPSSPS